MPFNARAVRSHKLPQPLALIPEADVPLPGPDALLDLFYLLLPLRIVSKVAMARDE